MSHDFAVDGGRVVIGSFAYQVGDLELGPDDIPGFEELWQAEAGETDFARMGCVTFRKMTRPVVDYIVDSVRCTLADREVAAREVDHIVFTMSDTSLGQAGPHFVAQVLGAAGLVNCVPVGVSFQQCCSSLTALAYGWGLFTDPGVRNVVVVACDFTAADRDRVTSYALFSDAVASCLIGRDDAEGLHLVSSAARLDFSGLSGRDSIMSRGTVAREALNAVLQTAGIGLHDVARVFPANLYEPLTSFNTAVAGIPKAKLHFVDTLRTFGHCGTCDWMLNLKDYQDTAGLRAGEVYLAQASAAGFGAWGLLSGI